MRRSTTNARRKAGFILDVNYPAIQAEKTAARGRPFALGLDGYFVLPELEPEAGDAPLLAPPGALRVPLPEVPPAVPPALGDDGVPAVCFSPRTSMSTRR